MSLQWRELVNGIWADWHDWTKTDTVIVNVHPTINQVTKVEVREKPVFEPGYYQQLTRAGEPVEHGFVSWWSHEPDLEIWKRVEVTDVS